MQFLSANYFWKLFLGITFLPYLLMAQPNKLSFQYFGAADGLQGINTRAVIQDYLGFIWVGTNNGLYRYNAYSFEAFLYDPNNPKNSISDNAILSLYEDESHRIWIGTNNEGLSCYNPISQTFESWKKSKGGLTDNTIFDIAGDGSGGIWIATKSGGLCHFNPETESFKNWQDPKLIPSGYVWKVIQSNDRTWLATNAGLVSFSPGSSFTLHPGPFSSRKLNISDMAIDKGVLWLTAWGQGLYKFDLGSQSFIKRYYLGKTKKERLLSCIYPSKKEGIFWIGSYGGGLCRWEERNSNQSSFQPYELESEDATPKNTLWTVLEDQAGDLWLGSISGLMHASSRLDKGFRTLNTQSSEARLPSQLVWSTAIDSFENLWIGTSAGLIRKPLHSSGSRQLFSTGNGRLANNRVKSLLIDSDQNLWVGYWGSGFGKYRYTPQGGWKPIKRWGGKLLSNLFVLSMAEDPSTGNLWIGTLGGAFCLVKESQQLIPYSSENASLLDNSIYSCYVSKDQTIWLGTSKGLHHLDRGSQEWKVFTSENSYLPHNKILCIKEDSKNNLWVGTDGGGLGIYSKQNRRWTRFTTAEGLPGNSIQGIVFLNDSLSCITTDKGISLFNRHKPKFDNFNGNDGLQGGSFSPSAASHGANGYLLLGGTQGASYFHPDSLTPNKQIPKVYITGVDVFGQQKAFDKSILHKDAIELSYEDKVLDISFTSLNYLDAEHNQFLYRLEGFDQEWRPADGSRRFASYTNLPLGEWFTFQVKASNNDGAWNEQGDFLRIYIAPPIWQTTAFRITAGILLLAMAWGFYQYRTAIARKQRVELEQQVKQRTEEIEEKSNQLQHSYQNITTLANIGRQVTSHLQLEDLLNALYVQVNVLMDADGFGIGVWDQENNCILFKGYIEHGELLPEHRSKYDPSNDLSSWCLANEKPIFINDIELEFGNYLKGKKASAVEGDLPQSLIYFPLDLKEGVKGVATVQSFNKNAYSKNDLALLENLASYLAIALGNISNFEAMEQAHNTIKQKNQALVDSLRYAETIQRSILPLPKLIKEEYPDYFLLYRPKDLVSGDFYMLEKQEDYVYWAVVDCTGHGVPGAFMSLIGHNSLDRLIHNDQLTSPAEILENLHLLVYDLLQQEEKLNEDGMELSICRLKKLKNGDTEVVFAGSKRPMVWFEAGELQLMRGTSRSIGGMGKSKARIKPFTDHCFTLKPGTPIYLFSDGLVDQNGAENGKFGTPAFYQLLTETHQLPMPEQGKQIAAALDQHQGNAAQRDDITVMGIRV